jgi:hypothetical protein
MQIFKRIDTTLLSYKSKSLKSHAADYNIAADRIAQLEMEKVMDNNRIAQLEVAMEEKKISVYRIVDLGGIGEHVRIGIGICFNSEIFSKLGVDTTCVNHRLR